MEDLGALLATVDSDIASDLASTPEVVDCGHELDLAKLPIKARRWHKIRDAVAVVVDLKSSTQLDEDKYPQSTAGIYEAATGNAVDVLAAFEADYIAIQGDGAVALFWGDRRTARALCAGITVKTFSEKHLVPRLMKKWPTLPQTGFKVGVASSPLLVKRVGIPRTQHQEPVWAGKVVNYAAKCAQQADAHELIVTGSVWDWVSDNDYLAVSCACGEPSPTIWQDATIERLRETEAEREGHLLTATWCAVHGAEYCAAVLDGRKRRSDVTDQRIKENQRIMQNAIRLRAAKAREQRRGLRMAS